MGRLFKTSIIIISILLTAMALFGVEGCSQTVTTKETPVKTASPAPMKSGTLTCSTNADGIEFTGSGFSGNVQLALVLVGVTKGLDLTIARVDTDASGNFKASFDQKSISAGIKAKVFQPGTYTTNVVSSEGIVLTGTSVEIKS